MSVRGHTLRNHSHTPSHNPQFDIDQPLFSTNIQFAWCPSDRIKEFCGDGPITPQDHKTRKRASGLDLLRPRSSKGQSRGDPGIPCPPILSPTITSPPLPVAWSTFEQSLSPQPVCTDKLSLRTPESKHDKDGSWDVIDECDLAPHSIRSSVRVPVARSRGSVLPVEIPHRCADDRGLGHEGSMQWMSGNMQLQMRGRGGREGGELRACNITHKIPEIPSSSNPRRPALPQTPPWEVPDIQHIHSSVLNRPHVLSLRLHGSGRSYSTISKASTGTRETRPKTSTGLSGVFGFRARGQTFSGRGSLDDHRPPPPIPTGNEGLKDRPHIPRSFSSTLEGSVAPLTHGGASDRTIFFCFNSTKEQDKWYNIFRSLAGSRTPDAVRCHRRLSLSILDLTEVGKRHRGANTDPAASLHTQDKSVDDGSKMSDGETRDTSGQDSASIISRKGKGLKVGWTRTDRLCMELRIDDVVRTRTTWTRAASKNGVPFWGEAFRFADLPSFSTCVLVIYRLSSKGKIIKIAMIDLSLVSDISSAKDERYAVKSIADGSVVGELRVAVSYQDIRLLPKNHYAVARLLYPENVNALYELDHSHSLDGGYDTLAKIGVASGHVYPLLKEMIDREAKGADSTLFRGNTPLSKLLEATLRLSSEDFLKRSIGPTVTRLAEETRIGTGSLIAQTGEPFHEEVRRVAEHIEACWADLYAARGTLPEPLKGVFGNLYWAVRHHHASTKERYFAYKAISSFLFLRLINPALIRPHLFGLRSGLYPNGSQKTATLVARVLSAMSFFSPRDAQRDPELALFSDIISSNSEMMLDYLSSFGVDHEPHPRRREPEITDTFKFVALRIPMTPKSMADSIPIPSLAGAIDVQAELGVLSAVILHRREGADLAVPSDQASGSAGFVRGLDKNLEDVARAAEGNGWREDDDLDYTDPCDASLQRAVLRSPITLHDRTSSNLYSELENELLPPTSSPWLEHEFRYDKASLRQKSRPASPLSQLPPPPPLPLGSRPSSPFSTQGPLGKVLETAQRAQHATGELVRRSLSSKRIGRRGSMCRLQIQVVGREADEPGRPKTARR